MKLLKICTALSLMLGMAGASAQIIEEDKTLILDGIQGNIHFSLDSGVAVYSFVPKDGWYKVRKEVWVKPVDVLDGKVLKGGTILRDENLNPIGEAIGEVEIEDGEALDVYRGDSVFHAIIEGWVFKTKFKEKSVPEERITEILAMKDRKEQQAAFDELFSLYQFEQRYFDDLEARVYREEGRRLDVEKDFRVIVLLRNSTPYAIITNKHDNITAPKIKMETEDGSFRTIYFMKPPAKQQEMIENDIVYTFLGL